MMRSYRSSLLIATVAAAVVVFALVRDETTTNTGRNLQGPLQGIPPGLDEVFWMMIRGGCWLTTLFQSGSRYANMFARSEYTNIPFTGEEALAGALRPNAVGPVALQGAFWLRIGPWIEAISFAPTNEGGGLSLGTLNADNNPAYKVRFLGDGTWGGGSTPEWINVLTDPVGNFFLEEGTVANPEKFRLQIDFIFPWTCTRMSSQGCFAPVLDWTMTLQNTPESIVDGRDPHPEYPEAIVWLRESAGLFNEAYEAIQVVDAAGNPIADASDGFIDDVNKFGGTILLGVLDPGADTFQFCTRGHWWCFWC